MQGYKIQNRAITRIISLAGMLLLSGLIFGHGTSYEILPGKTLSIKTMFDSGVPMAQARVLLFAPGKSDVYAKTMTDEQGIFQFTPDQPGTWVIQVRDNSGHGMRINLDIDRELRLAASPETPLLSGVRKLIMAGCIFWGFIGTGMYVKSRSGYASG